MTKDKPLKTIIVIKEKTSSYPYKWVWEEDAYLKVYQRVKTFDDVKRNAKKMFPNHRLAFCFQ